MLDSLIYGLNDQQKVGKMIKEVHRVLELEGVYILITYHDPHVQMPHFKDPK